MLIYFDILFFLILSNFIPKKADKLLQFLILFGVFSVYIGLRKEVGGDWFQYLAMYFEIQDNFFRTDIGYSLINILCFKFGLGIYGVNFIAALIFLSGLLYFIKNFKLNFSLSLLIAFPYLITVIAMGYTRQSIALGVLFFFFGFLVEDKKGKALFTLLLATMFHKTAFFCIVFLISSFSVFWVSLGIVLSLGIYLVFSSVIDIMYRVYFLETMQSSGGIIRLLLLSVSSLLFYKYRKKWKLYFSQDYNLVKRMSFLSVIFLILALLTHATTLFDRLSLYLYPLQLIVLSRILFLEKNKRLKEIFFLAIIVIYSLVFLIWIFFSSHRYAWVPYDNLLFGVFE